MRRLIAALAISYPASGVLGLTTFAGCLYVMSEAHAAVVGIAIGFAAWFVSSILMTVKGV